MTTLTDTLRPIVAELADVLAAKGELEAQERDLKARIRQAVPGPDTYAAGNAVLSVQVNRRFDPDKDKLRALLPEVFEAAQVEGDYRITVK
jgi:hypothetical protein